MLENLEPIITVSRATLLGYCSSKLRPLAGFDPGKFENGGANVAL